MKTQAKLKTASTHVSLDSKQAGTGSKKMPEMRIKTRTVHRTKAELIVDELRTLIVEGDFLPGQRLILRELAENFGCSEIPVREALNSLASLGLVKLTPHEGARVSGINLVELIELAEVRLILEREATIKALPHITPAILSNLKGILAKMELIAAKDAHAYGELNQLFHSTILNCCPSSKMVELIGNLREQSERGRAVHRLLPTHSAHTFKLHKRIMRAIAAGKVSELADVLNEHNDSILQSMAKLVADTET